MRQERPGDQDLDGMLAESITRLVMLSDNVSEADVRGVMTMARAGRAPPLIGMPDTRLARLSWLPDQPAAGSARKVADRQAIECGENEGMAPLPV
jgi:hypothetical protein